MIGLYIYLSGVLIIWLSYAYIIFIKKEELRKKHILPAIAFSIMSYLSILILGLIIIGDYIDEHGDDVVFNRKNKDDDTEIL